jgi:putative ABC transport system permease protein
MADRRLAMMMMLVFAGLTLMLSAVGLYGVTGYLVQARTREIGIRLAVGASRFTICRNVLLRGGVIVLVGIAIGGTVVGVLSKMLASRIPGLEGIGPQTLGLLGLALFAVAVAATLVPAIRATRVDPVSALRAE